MCNMDGDERADVWIPAFPHAAKEHLCSCCQAPIPPGRKHVRLFSVTDGSPDSVRACMPCWNAAKKFGAVDGHLTPHPTSLMQDVRDCVEDGHPEWRPMLRAIEGRARAWRERSARLAAEREANTRSKP